MIDPYEGSKKEGVKGFVKGAAKGVAGLLVKPVTGVLDASAKTAESITNTATIFDDKPNDQRIRVPRVFYERTRYFKKYKNLDSIVLMSLQTFAKGKYKNIDFLRCFQDKLDEHKILVLSYQSIFLKNKELLLQEIITTDIESAQVKEGSLYLTLLTKKEIKLDFQFQKEPRVDKMINKLKMHN